MVECFSYKSRCCECQVTTYCIVNLSVNITLSTCRSCLFSASGKSAEDFLNTVRTYARLSVRNMPQVFVMFRENSERVGFWVNRDIFIALFSRELFDMMQ